MPLSTDSPPASARSSVGSASRSAARSWWSEAARSRAVAAAVIAISLAYVATRITRSWGPPDEGFLGQSAERLLNGQLPHRDFVDLYTGGLTALHALAFQLFGTRLVVLRWVLFAAFACWLPILYAVCRRFASPLGAAAVTVLAVVWSVPTYPASMPTWYNVFAATAGLWALCKYAETDGLGWMVTAGVCAGLSICVKIVGVYFIGAAGLFIVYRALDPERQMEPGPRVSAITCAGVTATLYVAALLLLTRPTSPGTVLLFVVPGAAIAAALLPRARRAAPVPWARLWPPAIALAVGVAVAVLPLVLPYLARHDLGDLVRGVFVLPTRRLHYAARLPHARRVAAVLPLLALAWVSVRLRSTARNAAAAGAVLVIGFALVALRSRTDGPGGVASSEYDVPGLEYRLIVSSLMMLLPVVATAGAWLLARGDTPAPPVQRQQAFAALAVAALSALISFPLTVDLYFFFYAPLVLVAALTLVPLWGRPSRPWIALATIAVYVAFGVVHLDARASAILPLSRSGGLRVPPSDSAAVVGFVDTLRAHARNGFTYATPDCPEAYFLTGLRNPTPTMYEFFDDTVGRTDRILRLLDRHRITAVAISSWRIASGDPDPRLLTALRQRYPDSTVVWHFTVRWNSGGR